MKNFVFVNGCFDVLHRGHIELLSYAKSLGDFLLVAIDSDSNIKLLKGQNRPIHNQIDRKFVLESIRFVGAVVIFKDSSELSFLVECISPDIMVVGSDWKNKNIIGSEFAGEVRYFDRIGSYSTTKIIRS